MKQPKLKMKSLENHVRCSIASQKFLTRYATHYLHHQQLNVSNIDLSKAYSLKTRTSNFLPTSLSLSSLNFPTPPMLVPIMEGDLLESCAAYIVHQTNCKTKKSLGLSRAMFKKFPYSNVYDGSADPRVPGTIVIRGGSGGAWCGERGVVNLFGQCKPGKPTGAELRATREGWFKSGLNELVAINSSTPLGSVAFPHEIGCGLAGGTWANYERMINEFARQVDDVEVTIVRLTRTPKKKTKAVKAKPIKAASKAKAKAKAKPAMVKVKKEVG